jgi:chaperonin GroEL
MSIEYTKVKSASKVTLAKGPELDRIVLSTMETISAVVGATLGPGGMPVLIERYEHGLPSFVTKDGVTVFRSLGFRDSVQHCILEAARDAAVRTASEAGDGTTTATVLAHAIVKNIHSYCKRNPRVSPQRVVRHIEKTFQDHIEPIVRGLSKKTDLSTEEGEAFLHSVAKVSANGDTDLADAVMECYRICGDEGNVTIVEQNGPSKYETESIDGYAIGGAGWEDSCGKYYPKFINDKGRQMLVMNNVGFILYHGRLSEPQTMVSFLEHLGESWGNKETPIFNYVFVALGFSDDVLQTLALNFDHPKTINVAPLVLPMSAQIIGQFELLQDLAAITGAKVLDQMNSPLDQASFQDTGPGIEHFESARTRTNVVGYADEALLLDRVDEVKRQVDIAASILDAVSQN